MSDSCVTNAGMMAQNNSGHGFGGDIEAGVETNAATVDMAARRARERQHREMEKLIQRAAVAIDSVGPYVRTSGAESAQMRAAANWLEKVTESAGIARERQQKAMAATREMLSGTTVGNVSRWLGLYTKVAKYLFDKDAKMGEQIRTYAGQPGESENFLAAAWEQMQPRVAGKKETLMGYLNDIRGAIRENGWLRHSTWDEEALLEGAGHYAVARSMQERNAELMQRWVNKLNDAMAKGEKADIKKYTERIENLRDHIDDIDPPEGLVTGGYTNGRARKMQEDFLAASGLSRGEADQLADMLVEWNRRVTEDRAANGFISKEVLESFPEFSNYVPVKSNRENLAGPLNDAALYNPGKYYEMDGMVDLPESAFRSIQHYINRAALEYGTQSLAEKFHAIAHMQKYEGRPDMGVRSIPYDQLMHDNYFGNPMERDRAQKILNSGYGAGLVAEVPVLNAQGEPTGAFSRRYIYFDPAYVSELTGATGQELQQAMTRASKQAAGMEPIAQATSFYGQLSTRFSPLFAPVNLIRDAGERLTHIAGRSWTDENGNTVRGSDLLTSYVTNFGAASRTVMDVVMGRLDPDSKLGKYWEEYVNQGLHQVYTPGQDAKSAASFEELMQVGGERKRGFLRKQLEQRGMEGVSAAIGRLGDGSAQALEVLDKWNDYFNNVASFSQFITMREAGLSLETSGHGTLDLMNLRRSGYITPFLRMLFPYANVTAQSAAALAKTMGLAPDAAGHFHPNKRGLLALGGSFVAAGALYSVARESLGRDENGNYYFDNISTGELARYIPIPTGDSDGSYFKLQLPLGGMNIASTLALSMQRVERGQMRPEDAAFETFTAIAKNVSPNDWPSFSFSQNPFLYITNMLTPTLLQTPMQLATNRNFAGRPISYATDEEGKPKFAQGSLTTEKGFHDWAQGLHQMFGLDVSPEQVRHVWNSFQVGPARILRAVTSDDEFTQRVKDPDYPSAKEELGTFLYTLGSSMFYGKTANNAQSTFYNYSDRLNTDIRALGLNLQSSSYGSDREKRLTYQTNLLREAGLDDNQIQSYVLIDDAKRRLSNINRQLRKDLDPIMTSGDNAAIRQMFEDAGRERTRIYQEVNAQLRDLP